jgi:hypothetical protein
MVVELDGDHVEWVVARFVVFVEEIEIVVEELEIVVEEVGFVVGFHKMMFVVVEVEFVVGVQMLMLIVVELESHLFGLVEELGIVGLMVVELGVVNHMMELNLVPMMM